MPTMTPTVRRLFRPAFTLLELLVVIAIIVVALGLMVPSYGRLIESTNYSSAINLVTATLGNARAHAIASGRHTAVAFLFDVETERTSMVVLELAGMQGGVLSELPGAPPLGTYAQVFRPIPGTVPEELPRGTGVYAMAFTHVHPYDTREQAIDRDTWHWYAGEQIAHRTRPIIPWIFPRNDARNFTPNLTDADTGEFIDPWKALADSRYGGSVSPSLTVQAAANAVRHAATFCVQFSPEGTVVTTTPVAGDETLNSFIDWIDLPRDVTDPNAEPFDDPLLFDPEVTSSAVGRNASANPEVVLRSANVLAVVELTRLSRETGFDRPWFQRPETSRAPRSNVTVLDNDNVTAISDWIDDNASIIAFNRYTGNVIRNQQR